MKHPNFYENITEARARLLGTVVLYGDVPCFVMAICDHKSDDIFRVYLDPIGRSDEEYDAIKDIVNYTSNTPPEIMQGEVLDELIEKNPECGILRKFMNSAKFNRFRPFPLGMCYYGTQTYYVERQPVRPKMEQGLTQSSLLETIVTTGTRSSMPTKMARIDLQSPEFRDCVMGCYHEPDTILTALLSPRIANDSMPFHREFALVRGPLDMIFLGYRTEIIGVLPNNDFGMLRLGREFVHCKEVVEELNLFNYVKV